MEKTLKTITVVNHHRNDIYLYSWLTMKGIWIYLMDTASGKEFSKFFMDDEKASEWIMATI